MRWLSSISSALSRTVGDRLPGRASPGGGTVLANSAGCCSSRFVLATFLLRLTNLRWDFLNSGNCSGFCIGTPATAFLVQPIQIVRWPFDSCLTASSSCSPILAGSPSHRYSTALASVDAEYGSTRPVYVRYSWPTSGVRFETSTGVSLRFPDGAARGPPARLVRSDTLSMFFFFGSHMLFVLFVMSSDLLGLPASLASSAACSVPSNPG